MLLAAALLLALVALVVAGFAMHREGRFRRELESARSRLAAMDAELPKREKESSVDSVAANALRRDVRVSFAVNEARLDRHLFAHLLQDFRDVAGGEEAIFWRWRPERESLSPSVWSSDASRPSHFSITEWAPLLQWSAEERVIQTVGDDERVHVGAAPVMQGDTLIGVLSITHRSGLGLDRTTLREWLPRLATQLATVQELVEVRRRYARHMRQSKALLDAVQRLQGDKAGDGLAQALCETALEVSGARAAALVRWDRDAESGELTFATKGIGISAPAAVDPGSFVAEACLNGRLQVVEDARGLAAEHSLYGVRRDIQEPGSVAAIPIVKDNRILGALVIEADESGALTQDDVRPLTVLGAVVAGSLELAWQVAEVDKRARTDPLTGLWNRQHFGEQMQRTLAEADRYGSPVSLVLVDIDHFKTVNDTWGHEAGDAVLRQVSRILQDGVRAVDVCVRYGGEEIALLLAHTDSAEAVEVANRLRMRIAEHPMRHAGAEIPITASFGVATYPETVKVGDRLFPDSDKALYIAKHAGRNCVKAKPATKGRATS